MTFKKPIDGELSPSHLDTIGLLRAAGVEPNVASKAADRWQEISNQVQSCVLGPDEAAGSTILGMTAFRIDMGTVFTLIAARPDGRIETARRQMDTSLPAKEALRRAVAGVDDWKPFDADFKSIGLIGYKAVSTHVWRQICETMGIDVKTLQPVGQISDRDDPNTPSPTNARLHNAQRNFKERVEDWVILGRKPAVELFQNALSYPKFDKAHEASATVGNSVVRNWFAGGGNPEVSARRLQAATSYPSLTVLMSDPVWGVTAAIDAGLPLAPVLMETIQKFDARSKDLPIKSALRRLVGIPGGLFIVDGEAPESYSQMHAVVALAATPPDWTPTSTDEWKRWSAVTEVAFWASRRSDRSAREWISSSGGSWSDLSKSLSGQPTVELTDYLDRLERTLLWPVIADRVSARGQDADLETVAAVASHAGGAFFKAVLAQGGLARIISSCDRWHRVISGIDERTRTVDGDSNWLALFPAAARADGWEVSCLTSQTALSREGRRMNHCVGGYAERCLRDSHILALKSPTGERSTLQLRETGNEDCHFRIMQHRGPGNCDPSQECLDFAEKLRDHLQDPNHRTSSRDIDDARDACRRRMSETHGSLAVEIGFDPSDQERRSLAWALQYPFLPGEARRHGAAAWLRNTGVEEAIDDAIDKTIDKTMVHPPQAQSGTNRIDIIKPDVGQSIRAER